MKRVAIFRSDLLPRSETFIRDQIAALRDWEPILLGFREIEDGLTTPGIARRTFPVKGNRLIRACRFWLSLPHPDVVRRLRGLDTQLVHVHFGTDATDIWPSVRSAGLPMLVTLHGYDINISKTWWEAGYGGLRRRIYPRRLLHMAKDPTIYFIAVSEGVRRRAIDAGIPPEKITISYIGVDTERFSPGNVPLDQREKRILFVGRMVEKKAPLILIHAFEKVRKAVPDAELVMIGDGPLLREAIELANTLGVPVSFLGSCSSDSVVSELHEARVFCLPSITAENGDAEGLPISLLEAQACGVPCVTTAQAGGAEALSPSDTHTLVRAGNIEDLADALIKALTDAVFLADISSRSREWVNSQFSLQKNTLALQAIYKSVTSLQSSASRNGA